MRAKMNTASPRPARFAALGSWLSALGTRRRTETLQLSTTLESNPFLDGDAHLDVSARERLRRLEEFSAG